VASNELILRASDDGDDDDDDNDDECGELEE
jgi:hypothetical protein